METTADRSWVIAAPIVCGCALAGIAAFVALNDPADTSIMPSCPLYAMTGRWCPGCGLTRATHAVLNGDVAAAFGYNLLFPLFLGAIVVGWLAWMRAAFGRAPVDMLTRLPAWIAIASGVVVVGFGVLRNVPGFEALKP